MNSPLTFLIPKLDDAVGRALWKIGSYLCIGLGLGGVDHVADTAVKEGHWWCLHAMGGDVVFTSVTYGDSNTSGSLAGATLANGDRTYGNIVAFKLASGRVEAYRAIR
jgi:hypothetical protein